jgi:acyl-coenzyme A synthetase/AMP-(fatty) acid ligase
LPLGPDSLVAVEWTSLYPHWVILLAFETLGIVTATFSSEERIYSEPLLARANRVLSAQAIAPEWFAEFVSPADKAMATDAVFEPQQPLRIIQSSGTTGSVKMMTVTAAAQEYRVRQHLDRMSLDENARLYVDMALNVASLHNIATACLRIGGTCVWDKSCGYAEAVQRHRITHSAHITMALIHAVEQIPPETTKPDLLEIVAYGGRIPSDIRERALQHIATAVIEGYGANEAGAILNIDPEGMGTVLPGVTAETIDENSEPVIGKPGTVRIKSDCMVDGYVDDPEATAEKFKGGWFYPGDTGLMPEPGKLRIIGRSDELLNVQGLKMDPSRIERRLADIDGVSEACVTGLPIDNGNLICISLVLAPGIRLQDIQETIFAVMPDTITSAKIFRLDSLPKTGTGKVQRQRVNDIIREKLSLEEKPS